MRITVHMDPKHAHHKEYGDLFIAGLAKHGIKASVQMAFVPTDCNISVIWGRHNRAQRVIDNQLSQLREVIVMERGYFGDRLNDCTSISLLDADGLPYFRNQNSPGDRWDNYKELMKSWNPGKDYVLVMGQLPLDSAVSDVDIRAWVYEQLVAIKKAGFKAAYRPHPNDNDMQRVPADIIVKHGSLGNALKGVKCVVTYNSTSGVDAMLAGMPVIAMNERSMVYSIAGHDLDYIPKRKAIDEPDREQWAHDLAYCQWTKEELADGKAFAHLMGIQEDAKHQVDEVNQDR